MKLTYSLNEYITYIIMSRRKHLLVEGKDDMILFARLFEGFNYDFSEVDIDSAEDLIKFENTPENRERVELACDAIRNNPAKDRLVGFVDREFREFSTSGDFIDNMPYHKIDGTLVWSRGHSIENYYFDFETLHNTLNAHSHILSYSKALDLFKENFESTIRFACAASLVGKDMHMLDLMESSISWEIFRFEENHIFVDLEKWKQILVNNKKMRESQAEDILEDFSIWLKKVQNSSYEIVRWLCHGHIGMSFIWSAYISCVYEASIQLGIDQPEKSVHDVMNTQKRVMSHCCIFAWVEKAIGNQTICPIEVMKLLQLESINN